MFLLVIAAVHAMTPDTTVFTTKKGCMETMHTLKSMDKTIRVNCIPLR